MQLTCAAGVAGWRHAKQRISPRGQPAIEDWSKSSKGPHGKNRRQPVPAWQHAGHFNPGKVTLGPATLCCARVHLVCHLFARAGRRAFENLWIVIVQPLYSLIAIKRFDSRPHPATEVAMAVGVN